MEGSVYGILVELLIFVLIGFAFSRFHILQSDMSSKLSALLLKMILPFSLIASSQQEFSIHAIKGILLSIVLSILFYILSFTTLRLLLPFIFHSKEIPAAAYDLCAFANVGFLGFAVTPLIFGDSGTLFTISHNFIFQLLFFTIGMDMFEETTHSLKDNLSPKAIFTNKIILVSILSMVLYILPFRFPKVITVSISAIGSMMTPLSLIIVGLQIGALKLGTAFLDKKVISLTFFRMIVIPAIFFVVLFIIPFDSKVKSVAFILSAMPSGSLNAVIAERYQKDQVMTSSVVALTTILYFAMLPLDVTLISFL
ncbi:MAG: AEC family transporter [Candidatus Weimeria sp.]